ncbi:MAG: hypothetical protein DCF30_03355 [Hyphomicrobiales bacterium]|nr:MAG: hypothetical protein DCF30_03355 [Hyphomicrobiales bacterium]
MKSDAAALEESALWMSLPGGNDVIEWFGRVPDFHDAEIISLHLDRGGPSRLAIHFFKLQQSITHSKGVMEPTGDAIVTFELDYIVDLNLDGFGHQNVIYGLKLTRADADPARAPYYAIDHSPLDYEIELEPCYGLGGKIRARTVRLLFELGRPKPPRPMM